METKVIRWPEVVVWNGPEFTNKCRAQALMNTPVIVLERRNGWVHCQLPDYTGWIRSWELAPVLEQTGVTALVVQRMAGLAPYYAGTELPVTRDSDYDLEVALPDGEREWLPMESVSVRRDGAPLTWKGPEAAVRMALEFVGTPYTWGGVTALGMDCSGLVQIAWKVAGKQLPRNSRQQWNCTWPTSDWKPGDLLFFGENGVPDHVAMAVDDLSFIHALDSDIKRVVVSSVGDLPWLDGRFLGAHCVLEGDR